VATSNCAAPIKGRVIRIVKLDVCGNPVTGTSGMQVVHQAFTQVAQDPQYEDGTEFFERTASGGICVNQKDDPVLKRMNLTIDFCSVNVTATAFMASARELTVGSTTGYGFAVSEGSPVNRYSLEVWQEVAGSGACSASGLQQYIYNAWPNVGSTKLGGYTVELARSTLQLMSETRAVSATAGIGWLAKNGSANWLPAGTTLAGTEHWLWNITTTAPPTAACDPTANL
jgi:hypothetical protein